MIYSHLRKKDSHEEIERGGHTKNKSHKEDTTTTRHNQSTSLDPRVDHGQLRWRRHTIEAAPHHRRTTLTSYTARVKIEPRRRAPNPVCATACVCASLPWSSILIIPQSLY